MISNIVGLDGRPMASGQPYEAATGSPRGALWTVSDAGPNRTIAATGETLRKRSRHAYRNSPLLRSAINKGVIAEVGKGVVLNSICEDAEVRDTLNQLWKKHQYTIDPWGDSSFGTLLATAARARKSAGEVFIRKINLPMGAYGLGLPFQLVALEAEFCPMGLNKRLNGNRRIVQGIEFSGHRKTAVWLHKRHPKDNTDLTISLSDLVRVPMSEIIHHYNASRPGQVRGEPDTSAALLKDKEFADYSDAELNRKKTRSAFTGFLYRDGFGDDDMEFDPQTGKSLYGEGEDGEDTPGTAPQERETVQAGTVLRGIAGEKLELFEGDNTGSGYADFVKHQSQLIAASLDIPYPVLTGDWGGLSDRTIRAILNEYRRGVHADQVNLLGFQVCLRVWQWAVQCAVLTGKISAPGFASNPWKYYAVDLCFDAYRNLHPVQDLQASALAIKSMVSNPEREAAERGTNLYDNMRAQVRAAKRWQEICAEEGVDPSYFEPNKQEKKTA